MGSMVERMNKIADMAEKECDGRYPPRKQGWAKPWLMNLVATGQRDVGDEDRYMSYDLKRLVVAFVDDAIRDRMDSSGETHGQCDTKIAAGEFVFSSERIPHAQFSAWVKKVADMSEQPVDWTVEVVHSGKMKLSSHLTMRTTGDMTRVLDAVDALLPEHDAIYLSAGGDVMSVNSPSRRFARFRTAYACGGLIKKANRLEKELADKQKELESKQAKLAELARTIDYMREDSKRKGKYRRALSEAVEYMRLAWQSVAAVLPSWRSDDES